MKLISTFYVAAAIGVVSLGWRYFEPLISQNGTSVISIARDGKLGGSSLTVKLPTNLTPKQVELLNYAYEVAQRDGIRYPQYLQGILMRETRAGDMNAYRVSGLQNKLGDHYFGVSQLKLVAAKEVMQKFPEMWNRVETKTDEELQARLILDDKFNVQVASKYLLIMGVNSDPIYATTAYNQGPGGAKNVDPATWEYTVAVRRFAEKLPRSESHR